MLCKHESFFCFFLVFVPPLSRVWGAGLRVYTKDGGKPLHRAVLGEVERDIKGHSSAIAQSGLRKG